MKLNDCSAMSVMPKQCATCPFNENGCTEVRDSVVARTMQGINQTCHSTGAKHGKKDTHLCRGARDFQLQLFTVLGVIKEPTDAAWDEARKTIKCATV